MNEATIDGWGDASKVTKKLIGSWSFNRIIEGQATMQGVATFTPADKDRLAYREQGHLELANGTVVQAEREYIFSNSDGGFQVFFREDPPRLFHEISLSASSGGELSGSAGHLCNRDDYQSAYRFMPDGTFVIRHVVSSQGLHDDHDLYASRVTLQGGAASIAMRPRHCQSRLSATRLMSASRRSAPAFRSILATSASSRR